MCGEVVIVLILALQHMVSIPFAKKFALGGLNFLTLNRARPGIFVAPYLLMRGWTESDIGFVLFINCIVSLIIQTPIGIFADYTSYKRSLVALANILIAAMCVILVFQSDSYGMVLFSMAVLGVGYALSYPPMYSITLGLVGSDGIMEQVPVNETCIHAGNAFFAVASAIVVYYGAVTGGGETLFWICVVLGVSTCAMLCMIDPKEIDMDRARGLESLAPVIPFSSSSGCETEARTRIPPITLWRLLTDRKVIIFYVSLMFFHFSNASMLPLLAQVLYTNAQHGFEFACVSVAAAQISMIVTAGIGGYFVKSVGSKNLLLLAFAAIPVRGVLVSLLLSSPSPSPYLLVATQALDGAAGGLFGVIAVLIAENLSRGSGHFSVVVGTIKTIESLGAAFSNLLGENLAAVSYSSAYGVLSLVGLVPIAIYWYYMPDGSRDAEGNMVENLSVVEVHAKESKLRVGAGGGRAGVDMDSSSTALRSISESENGKL
jgi:MFS family permease